MGMVLTLVVVVDEDDADDAMEAAQAAVARAPVAGPRRDPRRRRAAPPGSTPRSASATGWSGETVLIRLHGEVAKHPESRRAAAAAARLPGRRLVAERRARRPGRPTRSARWRSAGSPTPPRSTAARATAMLTQCRVLRTRQHRPGLDPAHAVAGAAGRGARPAPGQGHRRRRSRPSGSAPAPTCSSPGWATGSRCRSTAASSDGPGHHRGRAATPSDGDDRRSPAATAGWRRSPSPAQPDRPVALKRRELAELLAEELRRLDPDDVYAATVASGSSLAEGTA